MTYESLCRLVRYAKENGRVLHLARCAKKKRVRKKNRMRIYRDSGWLYVGKAHREYAAPLDAVLRSLERAAERDDSLIWWGGAAQVAHARLRHHQITVEIPPPKYTVEVDLSQEKEC